MQAGPQTALFYRALAAQAPSIDGTDAAAAARAAFAVWARKLLDRRLGFGV